MSFNQAIETLVTQAAGGNNHELCAVYLARGGVIMTITFVLLSGVLIHCERILAFAGQDP